MDDYRPSAEAASEESPLWLIVLSDMMTNLMLFFIVMFAVSSQGMSALKAMQQGFANVKKAPIQQLNGPDPIAKLFPKNSNTVVTADFVQVTLPGPVLFPSGRADLSDAAKAALAELGRSLAQTQGRVEIQGHTDNVPVGAALGYDSNDELSAARAAAVADFFIRDCGLDPSRFSVAGYGDLRPVADNATPEGRAQNRRIEIVLQRHE